MIESLETRRLLAQLTIDGITDSTKPDNITLKLLSDGRVQVVNGGSAAIKVNGSTVNAGGTNSKSNIDKVLVNLSAGNDKFATDGNVNAKITVNGGSGNDTITGSKNNDSLLGQDGNDNLDAGSGNDFLDGGAGNDTAAGGKGSDTILGGIGNDSLGGGDDGDVIYGDNRNTNYAEDGVDTINGGNGLDFICGEGKADTLNGDNDSDIFSNIDGAADSINGGLGTDTCAPDGGDTKTSVEVQNSIVNAQNLNGTYAEVVGTAGNDVITVDASGGLLFISINGQMRADSISRLTSLGEGQVLLGIEVRAGAGNDTVAVNAGVGAAIDAFSNNKYFVGLYGDAGNDNLKAFEPAYFGGGQGNDTITGTSGGDVIVGGSESDSIRGGGGKDYISGDGGDGIFTTVDFNVSNVITADDIDDFDNTRSGALGAPGNDTIRGEDGDDYVWGAAGNDLIDGGQGTDRLAGGPGIDTSDWSDRTVPLMVTLDGIANDGGPGGTDNVYADFENIIGGTMNDTLKGNAAANSIVGGPGSDSIEGAGGNDSLNGGTGNDTLLGQADNDRITGDDNNDSISGGSGNDFLVGNGGDDKLFGDDGNDSLFGASGNDSLTGGTGIDSLSGEDGNDRIFNKDTAADIVNGGAGTDTADIDALDSFTAVESKV